MAKEQDELQIVQWDSKEDYDIVTCPFCKHISRSDAAEPDSTAYNYRCEHLREVVLLACGNIYGIFAVDAIDGVYLTDEMWDVTESLGLD